MQDIVGYWDMLNNNEITSYWEFTIDGNAIQDKNIVGTWQAIEDMIAIKFSNENEGYCVLSFSDNETVFGTNRQKNGNEYEWNLKKKKKQIYNDKIDFVIQGQFDSYTHELIQHYSRLNFVNNIIISCWEDDIVPEYSQIKIIKSKKLENPGIGNRNLQITSTLAGLQHVETAFAAKLRSDQKISLESLELMYDFYQRFQNKVINYTNDEKKPNNRICVAGIFKPFPFHPRDHIFWGNTQDLLEVFNIPHDPHPAVQKDDIDYRLYTRSECYICAHYCSKFNVKISNFITNPHLYLFDSAPQVQEALDISYTLTEQIFKPFPKINFEWPKYGLKNYHYDLTESQLGEYWHKEGDV